MPPAAATASTPAVVAVVVEELSAAAVTRRSIGRSWTDAPGDCSERDHGGLTGSTLDDEHADDLSGLTATADDDNFLSLRGPLSCCTAARAHTDRHRSLYNNITGML